MSRLFSEKEVVTLFSILLLGSAIGVAAALGAVAVMRGGWTQVLVAPAMLIPHAMTFYYSWRRIKQLEGDLDAIKTAKIALLGDDSYWERTEQLAANDTLTLEDRNGGRLLITVTHPTGITCKAYSS